MNDDLAIDGRFWRGLLRAAEAEPIEIDSLRGRSGLSHRLVAAGVDSQRRRLVVVSGEPQARAAALALADLQATLRAVQIVMIRFESSVGGSVNGPDGPGDRKMNLAPEIPGESDGDLGLAVVRSGDFSDADVETIKNGDSLTARSVLARMHLLQYFFPAPDHLSLALIERWPFATIPQVIDQLVRAPDLGHPFGAPEIVREYESFTGLIQELQQLGLVNFGPDGIAITGSGRAARSELRDRPREALADKLLNRMSASLHFKPIWLPVIRRQP